MERFGVDLNRAQLEEMIRDIQHKLVVLVATESKRVSHWRVFLPGGIPAIASYDSIRKTISTFFPEEFLNDPEHWD